MEITVKTENYGTVTVKDVMIDTDGTNLEEGISISDFLGDLLCEVVGYSTDSFDDPEYDLAGDLIDMYSED